MLLLRRARPEAASELADEPDLSHTLVPLTGAMARAWPVHARRCLHRLPERLGWAAPLLDPDHPSELECTHAQARELLLWLHHLPSYEHPIVGCHRHRPAQPRGRSATGPPADRPHRIRKEPAMAPMTRAARDPELDGEQAPTLSCFVVEHEPDADIPDGELAWWLQRQEQAETRAALGAAGLL